MSGAPGLRLQNSVVPAWGHERRATILRTALHQRLLKKRLPQGQRGWDLVEVLDQEELCCALLSEPLQDILAGMLSDWALGDSKLYSAAVDCLEPRDRAA